MDILETLGQMNSEELQAFCIADGQINGRSAALELEGLLMDEISKMVGYDIVNDVPVHSADKEIEVIKLLAEAMDIPTMFSAIMSLRDIEEDEDEDEEIQEDVDTSDTMRHLLSKLNEMMPELDTFEICPIGEKFYRVFAQVVGTINNEHGNNDEIFTTHYANKAEALFTWLKGTDTRYAMWESVEFMGLDEFNEPIWDNNREMDSYYAEDNNEA